MDFSGRDLSRRELLGSVAAAQAELFFGAGCAAAWRQMEQTRDPGEPRNRY
jgi:hypothetical protein